MFLLNRTFLRTDDLYTEEEFKRNLLQSEKSRAGILLSLFVLMFVVYLLLIFIFRPDFIMLFKEHDSAVWLVLIIVLLIIYEAGLRFLFSFFIKKGITPPVVMRYINAFVETSIPTVIIIVIADSINPFFVIHGPAPFAYFIFIVLSALRLDFFLCLFTGLIAALEFGIISAYYTTTAIDPTLGYLSNNLVFFTKSLFLLISGLAAGFVTMQVRKRLIKLIETVQERNRVMNLFGQQVSTEVANELLKLPGGAQKRNVCIMFLDIRDFSLMVEDKDPAEIVKFQNQIFSFMAEIVSKHKGIINQFLGDGFMATFGAPLSYSNDSQNAVNAAIEILMEMDARISRGVIPDIRAGIGLHTGTAVTGNVGSSIRKQYSVTGSVVILATRIEQLTKVYSARMLISEEVYRGLEDKKDEFVLLGEVTVKGREEPLTLYKFS